MTRPSFACLAFAVALAPGLAGAGGIDELNAFLDGAKNGRATFRQTVVTRSGRVPQMSSGTFAFARPGKFRWSYEKPFEQLVVGDGAKVWVYDRDLNQVIVRQLDAALGATPAALLAGDNALEKNFDLKEGGTVDGIEWVDAQPKSQDSGFQHLRIGFVGDALRAMELTDSFGQVTTIAFEKFERNPQLPASLFRFTPPAGADILGE